MELQQTLEIQFEEPKEKKNMELKKQDTKDYALLQRCIALIEQARMYVAQNVNTAMVIRIWSAV